MPNTKPLTHEENVAAVAYHTAGHAVMATKHGQMIWEPGIQIDVQSYCGRVPLPWLTCPGVLSDALDPKGFLPFGWDYYRRCVVAEVEIAQAGWLSEYQHHGLGSLRTAKDIDDVLSDAAYGDYDLDKYYEHVDDITSAAFELAREHLAMTGTECLSDEDREIIVRKYMEIQGSVVSWLKTPAVWLAVQAVAERLIEKNHLPWGESVDLLENACRDISCVDPSTFVLGARREAEGAL